MNVQFFFKKNFSIIKYICVLFILLKCEHQIIIHSIQDQSEFTKKSQLKLLLYSYDPFNMITRVVKNEFILNNFVVFKNSHHIHDTSQKQLMPCLDIISSNINHINVSVFSNGILSEYKIVLKIKANFFIPNKENYYPVNIFVSRTFIHNPGLVLPNTIQEDEMLNDMYQEAGQKLVQKFLMQLSNFNDN